MQPVLYSFRRCPYAIRARLAIAVSGLRVELREVDLKRKPAALLQLSPKATVPVLQLPDGSIRDESLDIMDWALTQHDPHSWLQPKKTEALTGQLIAANDLVFKTALDRYKYAASGSQEAALAAREQAVAHLARLEVLLQSQSYLTAPYLAYGDIALLPFVRQFAGVDPPWFAASPLPRVRAWLAEFSAAPLFRLVMTPYRVWVESDSASLFPPD